MDTPGGSCSLDIGFDLQLADVAQKIIGKRGNSQIKERRDENSDDDSDGPSILSQSDKSNLSKKTGHFPGKKPKKVTIDHSETSQSHGPKFTLNDHNSSTFRSLLLDPLGKSNRKIL